ncbi:hypothetical protein HDU93_007296 [Gonapodya sp. JEL0774]|nr:hypothetical protein HDU93_007296 [Gonapodya sp. JEL0774]
MIEGKTIAEEKANDWSRPDTPEEGELSDPGTDVSESFKRVEPEYVHRYDPPSGYTLTTDGRYYTDKNGFYYFDTYTCTYSYYDAATGGYITLQNTVTTENPVDSPTAEPTAEIEDNDDAPSCPPLRLIVRSSGVLERRAVINVENQMSFGRDRWDRRVRLKEMAVSKFHCSIFFSEDLLPQPDILAALSSASSQTQNTKSGYKAPSPYSLIDHGSTHGTFLNGTRISAAKTASIPVRLSHGDIIEVGSTEFLVHWHGYAANAGCSKCAGEGIKIVEPEEATAKVAGGGASRSGSSRRDARLDKTRRAYKPARGESPGKTNWPGVAVDGRSALPTSAGPHSSSPNSSQPGKYVDRARLRRELHPEDSAYMRQVEEEKRRLREAVMGSGDDESRTPEQTVVVQTRIGLGFGRDL